MRWMISYQFKLQGAIYDQVQIVNCHPAEFMTDLEAGDEYQIVRVYSAIEIPPRTIKKGEYDFAAHRV